MNPAVYGRNPLENSSFIASSINPDPAAAGRGFVARLSGSTAEMLSIWLRIFLGDKGFYLTTDRVLALGFDPAIPDWFFPENGEVWFTLFRAVKVIYRNPSRRATCGADGVKPQRCEVVYKDGGRAVFDKGYIEGDAALAVRDGRVAEVIVDLA
jgi:hypothetical protein